MNFELTEDQKQVQELVRRVAREKVAARANDIDATAEYPQDMFDLLKELGLFTLPFPEEYGGTEDSVSCCLAIEELGRVCYNTAYLLLVQWLPFGAILAGGSKEQKDKYLPGLASGDLRGAFSTTEPQSGSDVAGIKTRAVPKDCGYVINGAKIWCTNAEVSDFVLVAAKVGEGKGTGAINMFI
ncbi:MAG: acyl-CoA dehydrogenase family protein, partial [Sneathiella sp.]